MSAQDGALIGCGPHGHINCTACADAQRDQERRERAERREASLQALLHYITSEAARITGVPHEQPSDVVETIRQLYEMAESSKALSTAHAALLAAVRELGAAQDQWQADGTRASRELAWQKLTTLRALAAAPGPEGGER